MSDNVYRFKVVVFDNNEEIKNKYYVVTSRNPQDVNCGYLCDCISRQCQIVRPPENMCIYSLDSTYRLFD